VKTQTNDFTGSMEGALNMISNATRYVQTIPATDSIYITANQLLICLLPEITVSRFSALTMS